MNKFIDRYIKENNLSDKRKGEAFNTNKPWLDFLEIFARQYIKKNTAFIKEFKDFLDYHRLEYSYEEIYFDGEAVYLSNIAPNISLELKKIVNVELVSDNKTVYPECFLEISFEIDRQASEKKQEYQAYVVWKVFEMGQKEESFTSLEEALEKLFELAKLRISYLQRKYG